jgi:ATP-dependent Clp protease ATP-binding subunit ClpX
MTATPAPEQSLRCSFCGKAHDDVWKLFASRESAICDECVEVCAGMMAKEPRPVASPEPRQTEGLCSADDPGTTG